MPTPVTKRLLVIVPPDPPLIVSDPPIIEIDPLLEKLVPPLSTTFKVALLLAPIVPDAGLTEPIPTLNTLTPLTGLAARIVPLLTIVFAVKSPTPMITLELLIVLPDVLLSNNVPPAMLTVPWLTRKLLAPGNCAFNTALVLNVPMVAVLALIVLLSEANNAPLLAIMNELLNTPTPLIVPLP